MTPRLSCHITIFSLVLKSLLGIGRPWSQEIFAILFLKPRSHVRILIYRRWAIPEKYYDIQNDASRMWAILDVIYIVDLFWECYQTFCHFDRIHHLLQNMFILRYIGNRACFLQSDLTAICKRWLLADKSTEKIFPRLALVLNLVPEGMMNHSQSQPSKCNSSPA